MNSGGYVGPFRLLDAAAARQMAARLRAGSEPSTWIKGAAATSSEIYAFLTRPEILDRVEAAIGPDILLCGANVVERDPGQEHPWHADVHFAGPGRGVTLWVGLDGVDISTTLHVVPGSHRYGGSPQQMSDESASGAVLGPDRVRQLARTIDADAEIVAVPMHDGDAVLIDAALWHGTLNEADHVRSALVAHYAAPEVPIRIHGSGLDWPATYVEDPLPPCHLVRGDDGGKHNRVIAAPRGAAVVNSVHRLDDDIHTSHPDWKPDPLYRGPTGTLAHLLVKRHAVGDEAHEHDAHAHAYDQIIVTFGGEGELAVGGDRSILDARLGPASVAFLPAGTKHAARKTGSDGHVHIDVSFIGSIRGDASPSEPLGAAVIDLLTVKPDEVDLAERGRSSITLFEGGSTTTDQITIKRVDLSPGFRGAPDVDEHDVILVVHSGCLATLGELVEAGGVVIYGAGEEHQLEARGEMSVVLTVVELRGSGDLASGRTWRRRGIPSMGGSQLRRNLVRRLPRGVRLAVRRWRRSVRKLLTR